MRKQKEGVSARARRLWRKLALMPDRIGKLNPPGYEYRSEFQSNGRLFGLGLGMSFSFFVELYEAYDNLFMWYRHLGLGQTQPVWQLKPDVIAVPFVSLMETYFWWYLPWLLGLLVSVVLHYIYYYRGTKSIYVLRRVRSPYVVVKSCVLAPLIQLAAGAVTALVWYFLCYGIYLCVIPGECFPRFM